MIGHRQAPAVHWQVNQGIGGALPGRMTLCFGACARPFEAGAAGAVDDQFAPAMALRVSRQCLPYVWVAPIALHVDGSSGRRNGRAARRRGTVVPPESAAAAMLVAPDVARVARVVKVGVVGMA